MCGTGHSPLHQIEAFETVLQRLDAIADQQKVVFATVDRSPRYNGCSQSEQQLGEPPDEFLDPLVATLMTDPVSSSRLIRHACAGYTAKLETKGRSHDDQTTSSQRIVRPIRPHAADLCACKQGLAEVDQCEQDMVEPDDELRAQVEQWLSSCRK